MAQAHAILIYRNWRHARAARILRMQANSQGGALALLEVPRAEFLVAHGIESISVTPDSLLAEKRAEARAQRA